MKSSISEKAAGKAGIEKINEKWEEISGNVALAFRMTEEESLRFRAKNIAKLIGALPFIAGCEDPERTAVTHLGAYVLSVRETKGYFNAGLADNTDIFERLRLGSNFKGGDPGVIKKGMSSLALNMLEDYVRDIHLDTILGKYNPVKEGVFDPSALREELLTAIKTVECPEMDSIIGDDPVPFTYWGW